MADLGPLITKREADRDVFVPFKADDPELVVLNSTIHDKGREIDLLEEAIRKLKEKTKPIQEEFDNAIAVLKRGKANKMPCTEFFHWKERKMIVRRNDTNEIVSECELSGDAIPLQMNDEVVE